MSNLVRFMMMIVAFALLSFLNSNESKTQHGDATRSLIISPEKKLPV